MTVKNTLSGLIGEKQMTNVKNSDAFQQPHGYDAALELAQAGQYEQALDCMREFIRQTGGNAEVLNDTGAILHCLCRTEEAIEYFIRALNIKPGSTEIMWNLTEGYLALGKATEAVQLFDNLERSSVLNVDVLNRAANIFLNQGDKTCAVEMLLKSLQICPGQQILLPMLDVIRSKRPKIAFFCGSNDMKFLNDIIEFTKQRFEVRLFNGKTQQELFELMQWSDISWFEWCCDLAVIGSRQEKVCKNIIRLHRYEAYSNWPSQVRWENIDCLVTVGNTFVKDALLAQVPDIETRTQLCTIQNGVNLDKFRFVERPHGKNLACIGYMNTRKNPMLLLQCMQKLHYIDKEYKLFVAGNFQDAMLEQYIRFMVDTLGLAGVVFFDGWQKDVNSWLADKQYITSFSIGESQGMGILEAMACGLKPVIHNFPGADQIFPNEYIFNISEEFCRQVLSTDYEPQKYRRFVEQRYHIKNQMQKINEIFTRFETEINLQNNGTPFCSNGRILNYQEKVLPVCP
jgi:glycosyltransferase involved in cell wall biosynthesis